MHDVVRNGRPADAKSHRSAWRQYVRQRQKSARMRRAVLFSAHDDGIQHAERLVVQQTPELSEYRLQFRGHAAAALTRLYGGKNDVACHIDVALPWRGALQVLDELLRGGDGFRAPVQNHVVLIQPYASRVAMRMISDRRENLRSVADASDGYDFLYVLFIAARRRPAPRMPARIPSVSS